MVEGKRPPSQPAHGGDEAAGHRSSSRRASRSGSAATAAQFADRDDGIWDPDCFLYGETLGGLDLNMSKAERLDYRDSAMNHAMVLCGVNLDENGKPDRWKIENSWGEDAGRKGYFVASDAWFDRVCVPGRGEPPFPDRGAAQGAGGRARRTGALGPHGLSGLRIRHVFPELHVTCL